MINKKKSFKNRIIKIHLFFGILLIFLILVGSVDWNDPIDDFHGNEDIYYEYNLSNNVSNVIGDLIIDLDITGEKNITWDNGTHELKYNSLDNLIWMELNRSIKILTLNFTSDSQTGRYKIPLQAQDEVNPEGVNVFLYFQINATNDEPFFTNVEDNYFYPTNGSNPTYFINLSDEEEHYPLNFTIEFFQNCTPASWLDRGTESNNCTLFNIINLTGDSAKFNYTASLDDIGTYWAQLTVTESNPLCPHYYCDNLTYEVPHIMRSNFSIVVLSRLQVLVDECINMNFTQGEAKNCTIEVLTRQEDDLFNLTSTASFLNYTSQPSNSSWFFPLTEMQSSDFSYKFNITVNASHSLVGNWKINLSASREGTNEFNWSEFEIFVNWTGNNAPNISGLLDEYNTSINYDKTLSFFVNDYDYIIEDKDFWDESITVNITIIKDGLPSDLPYSINHGSLSDFSKSIDLTFSPTNEYSGEYTVFVNISDIGNLTDSKIFTLEVIDNDFPFWYNQSYLFNFIVNSTELTTKSNLSSRNLSRNYPYANDSDIGDTLVFSLTGTSPPNLSLSENGILNFFPWKEDVGYWKFNITVTDDKFLSNTSTWEFNVSNINSLPSVDLGSFLVENSVSSPNSRDVIVNQSSLFEIRFDAIDYDLLISNDQILNGSYNESLRIRSINITNITEVLNKINLEFNIEQINDEFTSFYTSAIPNSSNAGNYTVLLNISDNSNETVSLEFNLSIVAINSLPNITTIGDLETTILETNFSYFVNATDEEDDEWGIPLIYSIINITASSPQLEINSSTGEITFNFNNNNSYASVFEYLVQVNDSDGGFSDEYFNLSVHGLPNISFPNSDFIFNFSENSSYVLNFTVDYMINSTNLSYLFYMDNVTCYWINISENNFSCNHSELSLKINDSFLWSSNTNLSFNLSLNFFDETYGGYKNLSLFIFNTNYPLLNHSIDYSINVSHSNYNLTFLREISDQSAYVNTPLILTLSNYFYDVDAFDLFYNQQVNFILNISSIGSTQGLDCSSFFSFEEWNMTVNSPYLGNCNLSIIGEELSIIDNSSHKNVSSNWFIISFENPPQTPDPTPTPSSSTRVQKVVEHYSLKIIVPDDITLLPDDSLILNFSLINDGEIDLKGIDLSSLIQLGGIYSNDISLLLSESYIEDLAIGEKKDFSLATKINSDAYGDYRITIFANVSSPKLNDWGDFFIKVLSLDSSELSEILIFTEKFISENPECLELREIYNRAVSSFKEGDYDRARELTKIAINSCEDSISANEQIRFFDNKLNLNLFYSGILTLILFISCFLYYFYRRIKFKKSFDEEYI
jgi:hypothetical protein